MGTKSPAIIVHILILNLQNVWMETSEDWARRRLSEARHRAYAFIHKSVTLASVTRVN